MAFSIVLTVVLFISVLICAFNWSGHDEAWDNFSICPNNKNQRLFWANGFAISLIWFIAQLLLTLIFYT